VRKITSTVVVGRRALLREGVVSILQHTAYRIVATATTAADLKGRRLPGSQRLVVVLSVDGADVTTGGLGESIPLLRLFVDRCIIFVVVEASGPIDMRRILEFAPDGLIVNPGSRDILIKSLELSLMDPQVFILGQPAFLRTTGSPGSQNHEQKSGARGIADPLPAAALNASRLSQRERPILRRLARGDSNKIIARLCNIAESTVKIHLKAILRKTNANNRTQAAVWALTRGYAGEPVEVLQSLQPDKPVVEAGVSRVNGSLPHAFTPVAK
jgi:two-component system nitrate/nitrite response regulator NarL